MASFKEHITVGTLGSVMGVTIMHEYLHFTDNIWDIVLLMLTGITGSILPDIDDAKSLPARLACASCSMLLVAIFVTSNLVEQFKDLCSAIFHIDHSLLLAKIFLVVVCIGLITSINFFLPYIISKLTYHRGCVHSVPMATLCALALAKYLPLIGFAPHISIALAYALFAGFILHLCLDELYSIEFSFGKFRFKTSFGTALTLFSLKNPWSYIMLYGLIILLIIFL